MEGLRTGDGRVLPPLLRTEIDRLRRRLVLVLELIRELETDRAHAVEAAEAADTMAGKITALQRIRGIGENFAAVLAREVFYRSFDNRRQLASYVGITPMPYQSGGMDRDRSISRAGNPRARTTMIQLAWLWLRYQPDSALATWFRERVGNAAGAHAPDRDRGDGEKAADRTVALRGDRGGAGRRGNQGGNQRLGVRLTRCRGRIAAGADTGSATVFFFGSHELPRFRWVASRRGRASCKRHYGAGRPGGPDRM